MTSASEVRAAMLAKLRLSRLDKVAARLGFEPLTGEQLVKRYPQLTRYPAAGFLLPYFDSAGKRTDFFRYRYLEQPALTGFDLLVQPNRKAIRYIQPAATDPCQYFAPLSNWAPILRDAAIPLFVTEGELKAACAVSMKIPTIGLGGVSNFQSATETFLPDLEQINWKDRAVYIVFDSDIHVNRHVLLAANRFGQQVLRRGAIPLIVRLDEMEYGTKTGLDDYLVAYGPQAFHKLVQEEAEELESSHWLHELNKRVIYVHNHSIFEVATGQRIKPDSFTRSVYSDWVYEEKIPATETKVAKIKTHHVATEWMQWAGRAKARAYVYVPGAERILPEGVNDWNGWGVATEYVKKGSVAPWTELLDHLFSDLERGNRRWVEQWFAYPLQNPGAKMPTAVLNWGRHHGTGKDLLALTLATIYGENAIKLKESDIDSSHNELFEHRQFISFEELSGGTNNRRIVGDRFKTLITQAYVNINPKFLRPYRIKDCINYYVTSNHSDPLYIEPEDRRWFVNQVTRPPITGDFYGRYMKHFGVGAYRDNPQPENSGALFHHLLTLDMAAFDITASAPVTAAKQALIVLSQNDSARWATMLRENPDSVLIYGDAPLNISLATEDDLWWLFTGKFTDEPRSRMRKVLSEAGITQVNKGRVIRKCGVWGSPHLYAVRNVLQLLEAKEKDLAATFNKERKTAPCPFDGPMKRRF